MKKYGLLLAMAAVVAGLTTACTDEDDIVEKAVTQKVHITVGAGIGSDDATTRSEVGVEEYYDDPGIRYRRTLKFTEGDKIYFCDELKQHPTIEGTFRMAGELTVVPGSISPEGTSATFAGDLTFYKLDANGREWSASTEYMLQNPDDPMQDLKNTPTAHLVHKGGTVGTGFYTLNSFKDISYNYRCCLAADVVSLMTSYIEVSGQYDFDTKCFELEKSFYPIFNCNISGLTANTTYYVGLIWNEVLSGFNNTSNPNNIYVSTITTNAEGRATFAITAIVDYEKYCALWFGKSGGLPREGVEKSVYLGHHTFVGKVYNVTKTAEDRVSTITKPLRKM